MSIINAIQNTHENEKVISKSIFQIQFEEHTLLKINHPTCEAAVSLQGAHLLYWKPSGETLPVVWLSEKTFFKKEIAIRGGIPICWPWFSNVGTPSHGFARIVDWELSSFSENTTGVELVLSLKNNNDTKKYWPHTFTLELKLHLGNTCKAELSCSGDFEITSALHTYFGIDDILAINVTGLGESYLEKLPTPNEPKVIGEVTFDQEVDRVYKTPEAVSLIKDTYRTIKISHHNHSDVVTWNPWIEKSKSITDLADDSYHQFVCVETCRINKPIKSTAQKQSTYSVEIEVVK